MPIFFLVLVRFPSLVVLGAAAFNVFTFVVSLQQGRFSVGSVRYLVATLSTLPAAQRGDLIPFLSLHGQL